MTRLSAVDASLAYDSMIISRALSVEIPDEKFTVIVGPNACGKSTLLKALARLLLPTEGHIMLDGDIIQNLPTKTVAREIGLLPQGPVAPEGVRVVDLVNRGRYPHQKLFSPWTHEDDLAVARAMEATGVHALSGKMVDELSGGQRQRVWMAVALAQETDILLLDEPTTYLDLNHQIELLELCRRLNREEGTTMVAVLHDLNQAARYGDHIIAMKDGSIVAQGSPEKVFTEELLATAFRVNAKVICDPESQTPLVIPRWDHRGS
ncbi:ABC transporter ATP-binding protein [Corynebacterium propinquum]